MRKDDEKTTKRRRKDVLERTSLQYSLNEDKTAILSVDGWASYPNAILRAFVEQVDEGIQDGKQQVRVWSHLVIGQVIKTQKKQRNMYLIGCTYNIYKTNSRKIAYGTYILLRERGIHG